MLIIVLRRFSQIWLVLCFIILTGKMMKPSPITLLLNTIHKADKVSKSGHWGTHTAIMITQAIKSRDFILKNKRQRFLIVSDKLTVKEC